MSYHLSKKSARIAVRHFCKYGDTDIFPRLPEVAFLHECEDAVVTKLASLDLDNYVPGSAFEALAPKSRYGFRIAHQLPMTDALLLLAAVIDIAPAIEARRAPSDSIEAFSYRVELDQKGRGLFRTDRTYKDWLQAQVKGIQQDLKIKQVISTDISDFYARINFHRLDNLLGEVVPNHGAAKYIKRHIKAIRAKQSFGLPVGGSAARILAELALVDIDKALRDQGIVFSRFVDDFRLFLTAQQNPYDVLAFLAEQLAINEGLALNASKTTVSMRAKYLTRLKELTKDVGDQAEGEALDSLVADLYFGDEPDPDEFEKLKNMNLLGFLQEEAGKDAFDMGRIKVIFRALKLTKPLGAIQYLTNNFTELVVFAKDVTLLMQALEEDYPDCFSTMGSTVVSAILAPPAASVQVIRTWLLEVFVRGTVPISPSELKRLYGLSSPLDQRQICLIRGRVDDKLHFRKLKTAFSQQPPSLQTCVIWGASCLPKDEYGAWLTVVKPMYAGPLGNLFIKWAQNEQKSLIEKLDYSTDEHQD